MSAAGIVLVALAIAVGIIGIVVPLLPGTLLVFVAIVVWAVVENNITAWVTLGVVSALLGSVAEALNAAATPASAPDGGVMLGVGATLSTVMVWLAVLVLPRESVAVQLRVMVLVCGQLPGVVASTKVGLGDGLQLSLAVGLLNTSG